jgi:hypothetical protein
MIKLLLLQQHYLLACAECFIFSRVDYHDVKHARTLPICACKQHIATGRQLDVCCVTSDVCRVTCACDTALHFVETCVNSCSVAVYYSCESCLVTSTGSCLRSRHCNSCLSSFAGKDGYFCNGNGQGTYHVYCHRPTAFVFWTTSLAD